MKRRQMLVGTAQPGLASALRWTVPAALASHVSELSGEATASTRHAVASADQIAWQDLEVGMFVHFAPNTWQDEEYDNLSTPVSRIDPKQLDTDQWAQTAIALGAKYIVFVAKHVGGFCMWQTQTTDYGIRNTPWRGGHGDVLADVFAACRKHRLKLGVYVSPRDDHLGANTGGICKTPQLQARYDAMYREQLTEVLFVTESSSRSGSTDRLPHRWAICWRSISRTQWCFRAPRRPFAGWATKTALRRIPAGTASTARTRRPAPPPL